MKKLIMSFCILVGACGFFSISSPAYSSEDDPILTGKTARADLQKKPYSKWFTKNYESYKVDSYNSSILEEISQDIKITIIMGTWCHDSQREVPRIFKIFDNVLDRPQATDQKINIITVKPFKERDPKIIKKYAMTGVPTIIFSRNNKEIGRITEKPNQTLEEDMVKIISAEMMRLQ